MADGNKIPVSVQYVNLNLFEATAFDEIVDELIDQVNNEKVNFVKSPLLRRDFAPFKVKLFYAYSEYPPKWRSFLEPLLDKRSTLAQVENLSYSYVCFIGLEENIYAITGGFAGQKVNRFMIPDFGLEILVRVFSSDSRVVKNIQDRGLTGNLLAQTKFYRGDQRFSDENQFGKIFKQVQADLNKELLKTVFGFTDEQLKRNKSVCMAKDSFQIHKAIDFDTMLSLVSKIADLMKKQPKFSLNKVEHISRRKPQNEDLLNQLDLWVQNTLYNACKSGHDADVDFCHKKFEDYFNADSIEIIIDNGDPIEVSRHSSFSDIVKYLKDTDNYIDDDEGLFKASVLSRKVVTYDSEGVVLTSGSVFHHIHGEFSYNDNTYFLLDKEWYFIKPKFIRDLNVECLEMLKYVWDINILTERFDLKRRESTYNQKYINKPNFFVFDTITPDNIESCDIMKYDDNSIYLIHVKKGFNNSIRDLTSQINIAAKRVQDDLRTGFGYIERVEQQTRKSNVDRLKKQQFPKNGIASLFKNKSPQQINFCLAFVDKASSKRNLKEEINKFNSNIAKFSLLELKRELYAMGFGFKIIQLTAE